MRAPPILNELFGEAAAELRAVRPANPRSYHALGTVAAVALAVFVAHHFGVHGAWWAGISAFAVMQFDFGSSFYRGMLRVLGTVLGGLLAYLAAQVLVPYPVAFVLALGAVTWIGLYGALAYRHSYAFVLGVVTFAMVMCDALAEPGNLAAYAVSRVLAVVIGTLACVLVAAAMDARVHEALGSPLRPAPHPHLQAPAWVAPAAREAAVHALPGAVVALLLGIATVLHPMVAAAQAMVTTIAVLVVPPSPQARAPGGPVVRRMVQRFLGCLLAGALAFVLLPVVEGHALACQIALALGVWLGAYLQDAPAGTRYMATQFAVAFIMVFVQDAGWTVQEGLALQRLAGMLAGILVLLPIIRAVDLVAARTSAPHA